MVSDWKQAWKWFSVHVAVVIALLNAAQAILPQVAAWITPGQFAVANAVLGVAVIVARLINQGGTNAAS